MGFNQHFEEECWEIPFGFEIAIPLCTFEIPTHKAERQGLYYIFLAGARMNPRGAASFATASSWKKTHARCAAV